jgi:DNA-binding NtrC family response regulator
MKSVLYLGCPAHERPTTEKLLGAANVSVVWADDVTYALSELEQRDLPVLLDLSRGDAALQSAREIRHQRAATLMFAVVDARRPDLTTEAVLAGMADIFARPLGGRRVACAIAREQRYESREPAAEAADDLYCQSPAMLAVMPLVERAAKMRAGVMIRGEEGTGRQVAARAIHAMQNNGGAFVTVDCSSREIEDLDRCLFGHAGRSHGGESARGLEVIGAQGRLYEALGGTIYLQNVAEAPTRVQSRLARVLRDREATLADTGESIVFDVRPMASAGDALDVAVEDGRVRDDLFRRLSVIRIDMPPLRQRREDIPALANYFLRDICAELRVPPKALSRPALSLISALPWRGNATELRILLERVLTGLPGGRGIGLDDVLPHVRLETGSGVHAASGTLKQARAQFEREYIAAVLDRHRGRISEAARALGLQRTNLYRKMRSLRVNRERRR